MVVFFILVYGFMLERILLALQYIDSAKCAACSRSVPAISIPMLYLCIALYKSRQLFTGQDYFCPSKTIWEINCLHGTLIENIS
jgi:hypothetical protein